MQSKTNEQALESAIEKKLAGISSEEVQDQGKSVEDINPIEYGEEYYIGDRRSYNPHYAVDTYRLWSFLEKSQPDMFKKLKSNTNWEQKFLDRYDRVIKRRGILDILRKGLEIDDMSFTLFYQPPSKGSGETAQTRYALNEFSVTRQIPYNADNPREDIDMVIFINGLPVVTMELKNQWTGQNARTHGINQYKYSRDNKQPLLQFARAIVHFAVDPEEVYMTTKLNGTSTFFLPFNKGNNFGSGNPVNPYGHKTAYLWEEILQKDSLATIIQNFVMLDGDSKEKLHSRTLFFPRYHQLDVVRRLISSVERTGVGGRYLIQHSAGSGKSNSITWLAFQLLSAHGEHAGLPGIKSVELPIFDSVIVVTDRRLLDRQIRDNITSFAHVKSIVGHSETSAELRQYLEQGKRIIITTIQKFPFIIDEISGQNDKTFAVLIDEAHSSQGGITAQKLNVALGAADEDDNDDNPDTLQEKILAVIEEHKMRTNTSYFAFTATPKNSTLERFGTQQDDGSFQPFHLYSMKQAIEERFILDVLSNYTTYKSYYEITKSIEDNPQFDTARAQKKLKAYVEKNPKTISVKAGIMLNHFMEKVYSTHLLKGKAKGMVVTQSIKSAIYYYKALNERLRELGNPFKILIAFSGTKKVDGIEYTEASMNGFSQEDTRFEFDGPDYRLLVVANKYLTGFDQPKLTIMYVDKRLSGITAVQALSRLNRSADKLGKKKEDLFVLDFFNTVDEIKEAFDPFYTSTSLTEATDINVLHDIKADMDDTGIYEWPEVEDFNSKYFKGVEAQELSPILDVSAERFNREFGWTEDEKADFKIKAKQFVKIYGQVSAILTFSNVKWEMLFWYLKFLIPKLHVKDKDKDSLDELLDSVDLSTYAINRSKANHHIVLDPDAAEIDPQNPNPRGVPGGEEERDFLDEIIKNFNERYFQAWDATAEEQRVVLLDLQERVRAHPDYNAQVKENSDMEAAILAFNNILDAVVTERRRSEVGFYKLYARDHDFNYGVKHALLENEGLRR